MSTYLQPRMAWVKSALDFLNEALFGEIEKFEVRDTGDPLKKTLYIWVSEPITGTQMTHVWNILQAFAKANDCEFERSTRGNRHVAIDMFIKYRLSQGPMNKNPLLDPKTSRDKARNQGG